MSGCGGLCRWCLGFLFSLGLAALFLWLTLRPSAPSLFINDLSRSSNTTFSFLLRLKNENKDKGVYYDNITLSFFFPANSSRPLGPDVTIPAFYQGHGKKANKQDSLRADQGSLPPNGTAAEFAVRLETRVRYKIWGFKTVRHGLKLHGEVSVDEQGKKVGKKGVELRSSGPPRRRLPNAAGFAVMIFTAIFWIAF